MTTLLIGDRRLALRQGDITEQTTDAIVNAANSSLLGGGGVDGAIHRRGGSAILEECRELRRQRYPNGLPVGEAVMTGAGNLAARHVIHTVGPIWRGGLRDEDSFLRAAYRHCLELANEHGLRSIAFPSISTGAYGFPSERAAPLALRTIVEHLLADRPPCHVVMVLFYPQDLRVYRAALHALLPTLPVNSGLELEI
jgi:O-acetyl-ADP-ribose deacetylase (regulator of RNase III)